MASKYLVVDELDDSKTAKVYSNRALKISSPYTYATLASAAGTGVITTSPCILHSVIFTDSATATTQLLLLDNSDSASAATIANGYTASAVGLFGLITKNTFIYDAIIQNGLLYRVSGSAMCPTIITYSVAS